MEPNITVLENTFSFFQKSTLFFRKPYLRSLTPYCFNLLCSNDMILHTSGCLLHIMKQSDITKTCNNGL